MPDPTLQSQVYNTPVTDFGMPSEQITPLQNIQKSLQNTAKTELQLSEFYKDYQKNQQPNSLDSIKDNRIKLTDYKVDINEAYNRLSSGEYTPMYKDFIQGTDNNERFAQQQTTGEKWVNGVEKALLKTGNAVLGGTAGIVYGIGKMATEGSLSALYDNDFSNTLADWDTKLNYQLPNYYTKQESEKGIFGQAATANFWADKVLGGLSFTAGAIISEGIWAAATGGTSLAVDAARWGARFGRGAVDVAKTGRWTVEALGETGALTALAKNKSFLKQAIETSFDAGKINIKLATNLGKTADLLNTARFTATSAGFESSVEALQYKKEATENFYNTFYDKNGREPNSEDIATFNENLKNSANAVFGVNMAIVGSSNLVTMGKLFELENPIKTGIAEFIEKKAFGYGVEKTGVGAYKVLEATKAQKIARNIFAYSEAPITEGIYEEGLQGVTTKVANKWINHTYNDKNTTQTFSTMGAVYESLAEQYGTKEGWVENGVGMIIGVLGGLSNTHAGLKGKEAELDLKVKGLETFNPESKVLQQTLLARKVMMSNQITGFSEEAKIEAENGNIVKSDIAGEGVIHAFLNHKYYLNENFEDVAKEVKTTLDTITIEQFKNAGIEEKDIDNYKETRLNEFIDKAKSFKKNRKFSEYIIGKNPSVGEHEIESILGDSFKGINTNQALIESLTWVLTEGETAGRFINDIQNKISDEVGTEHKTTIDTISKLNRLKGYKGTERESIVNDYNNLTRERDRVQEEIAKLNAAPKETEGDRTRGKALEEKNLRLLDLNNNITELDNKLNGIVDELNKQESYRKDISDLRFNQDISGTTITARDLLNLNENVTKFQDLIESLKVSDPQRGAYLSDLMDEYAQAEDIFLTNQRAFDMLSSGKIKLDKVNTYLGKKLFKNKSMDEATKDWLIDALNKHQKNVLSVMGAVTEEQPTVPKTKEELLNRKEELEAIPKEERTEEDDKELLDIEENLKEEVKQNRSIVPQSEEQIVKEKIAELEQERDDKIAELNITINNNEINRRKSLQGWAASYELGRIAKIEGVDLSKLSREEYADYAITNNLAIDDAQLRAFPSHRNATSVEEVVAIMKEEKSKIKIEIEKAFASFSHSMMELANKQQNERFLSPDVRVLSGTKDSNSWLFFSINNGTNQSQKDTYKSYFSLKDLNNLTPDKFKEFMKTLQERGYNGGVKIFQDLTEQGTKLNDQVVMHGYSEGDAKLALDVAKGYFGENIAEASTGKDEIIDGKNLSYSQILAEKIQNQIKISVEIADNSAQINKINREYNQKIQNLKKSTETSKSPIEDYKNRIEKMLSKGYYSLEKIGKTYEDLKDLKPTEAEIEEFRNLDEGERYNELSKKLSNWKLLDSATDGDGNSIADLVKIIKQHEKPIEESDVKTFLTDTDIDSLQEGSGDIVVNGLLQNILGHVKVKKLDTGKYRFTHLNLRNVIERLITDDIKPTVKGVAVSLEEIDALKPGAIVTILNTEFILGESGRIEVDIEKFKSIKQALGFELLDSGTNWSYKDVYEFNGVTWIKVESQYKDDTFEESTIFEAQKDDEIGFEIGNENGYNLSLYNNWIDAQKSLDDSKAKNKTKLRDAVDKALNEFKNGITIYAVDRKGRRLPLLKAGKSTSAEDTFLQLRQRAFDNFNPELDKIDLKVTTKIVNVYLGSPQLMIFDGKVQDISFTKEAITQVVATGYIQDGEVVTSQEFPNGVDTSFIAKISKKDTGKKVPFIVIKKGAYNIAYPVTTKIGEPKTSELSNAIANKDTKQQVIAINELIQKYNIPTELLIYGDLKNNSKIEEVKSAFENYESHVSMESFASSKYDKNNLLKDATINIDIEDDSSISDPKVRVSLDAEDMYFEEAKEVLEAKEISTITKISNLADELYDELFIYQSTPIMHENRFIDIILDGYTPESEKGKPFPKTIFPNRVAATQGDVGGEYSADAFTAHQRGFNILKEAFNSLTRLDVNGKEVSALTTEGKAIIDKKTINRISNLFKIYDRNKLDMEILKKDKNSGKNNVKCP
jgi:hypothetical protein